MAVQLTRVANIGGLPNCSLRVTSAVDPFGIEANDTNEGVYLDFSTEIQSKGKQAAYAKGNHNPTLEEITVLGKQWLEEKYGNLFTMYQKITDENPYETPMKIYPAVHYTMGGVWVDYNLQSTIPGCFVAGEANFSDHGANRLGASALMQGLADGYFVLPYTVSDVSIPKLMIHANLKPS